MRRKERREKNKAKVISSQSKNMSISLDAEYSEETDFTVYETPLKYKAQIRQRTHDFKRNLPKSKELQVAVVGRVVGKLLHSPSTSLTMKRVIRRHSSEVYKRNDHRLVTSLIQITKYKTSNNMPKFIESVDRLREMSTIRNAARQLNMHYNQLRRLLIARKQNRRLLTADCKENVMKYYASTKISLQLPFKRYSKFYYLRTPLSVAYAAYADEQKALGCRVLSFSSVYRCVKGLVRTRKKIPFKDTQCAECVNNSLLADALIVGKVKGIKRRITDNILNSFCKLDRKEINVNSEEGGGSSRRLDFNIDNELITDHKRECIFRECKMCSAMKLQEYIIKENEGLDWKQEVTWHQWKTVVIEEKKDKTDEKNHHDNKNRDDNVKGNIDQQNTAGVEQNDKENENVEKDKKKRILDKVRYRGALSTLLSLFIRSISSMSVHLFHFRWQAMQIEEAKKQLQTGDVLLIMDFATNHSHHRQDEIHGAFWCRKQTTLHPIIVYYPCPEEKCEHLVRDEVMIFSDDLKHDSFAVNKFVERVVTHLKEQGIPVKRIVMWSDNCGPQYKSCRVFDSMSKVDDIPIMRDYFCARHGKAEADGAIGRLSMHIDAVVRSGTYELGSVGELTRYCVLKLTIDKGKGGMCCHWQRHYFQVENIIRDTTTNVNTVKGTLTFHSVRNVGRAGIIEVRESSCYCNYCFLNLEGVCRNAHLVKPFAWATLYRDMDVPDNFENKLWGETTSLPFRYIKKHMFVPKHPKARVKEKGNKGRKVTLPKKDNQKQCNISNLEDSDFEYNLPLIHVKEGLKNWSGESPIFRRTRIRKKQSNVIRCEEDGLRWDLDDYEGSGETENKNGFLDVTAMSGTESKNNSLHITPILGAVTSTPKGKSTKKPHFIVLSPIGKQNDNDFQDRLQFLSSFEGDVAYSERNFYRDDSISYDWSGLHKKLLRCRRFADVKKLAGTERDKLPALPEQYVGDRPLKDDQIDHLTMQYIPPDMPQDLLLHHAITIEPDGNCFCRSISRLVYGSQNRHLEIRCRIVLDSALNIRNYTNGHYLMRKAQHIHSNCFNIASYYCDYSGVGNIGNRNDTLSGICSVFREDVMRIIKLKEHCGPWQFHSTANMLKAQLSMVFPSKNIRHNVRVDFNRVFLPSSPDSMRMGKLCLMWTSTFPDASGSEYNHIVPLIRRYRFNLKHDLSQLKQISSKIIVITVA